MARELILEMAVQDETDVFNMEPVASVTTEITDTIEGKDLRKYVFQIIRPEITNPSYSVTEHDIGVLISHHCGRRRLKKAALLTLPYIINANLVTASWKKKKKDTTKGNKQKDTRPSGMISAPILINGIKYLCNLTVKKNTNKTVTPYALALKDANGKLVETEKMVSIQSSVPDSSSEPTTIGDVHSVKATTSHDTNPSFQSANVQQNTETNNNNDIKTENIRMNKKLIRLTESDLHRIVKESVKKVLREDFKHNKEAKRLHNQSVLPSDKKLADEYEDIPWKIKEGLEWLSWLLPNNIDVKRMGVQQRVSKEIINAVQILSSNQDTVIDAVMNSYTQFLYKGGSLRASNLDRDITNGVSLQDRYDDYFGDEVENDWNRARDNDYEY